MQPSKSLLLLCFAAIVSACAAHPDPIIDTQGVDQEQLADDWSDCETYSDEVQVARGTAKGAGLGAVVGAVAGAIGGNTRDVGEGAAEGVLYGGASSGLKADQEKQMVFKRCMSGRGYRVLN